MVKKICNMTFVYPYSGIFYNHLNLPFIYGGKKNKMVINRI